MLSGSHPMMRSRTAVLMTRWRMRYASRVVAADRRVPSLVTHCWTSLWVIDPIAWQGQPDWTRFWLRSYTPRSP